jgi:hypothetical protein
MRFIISIAILILFLTLTIGQVHGETKNDLLILPLGIYNNNSIRHNFTLGDSSDQISQQEKIRAEELSRVQLASLHQRSQRVYAESSGGFGQATIIAEDTQYFNCAKYAKAKSGISASIGNGGRQGINTNEPRVGEIGVERNRYHAVYIEKVEGDEITITEANFYRGFITMRVLHRSEFLGFIV